MIKRLLTSFGFQSAWPKLLQSTERPLSPREQFGPVFDVIQLSHTFSDSKTFVDTIPRKNPYKISKDYFKLYGTQLDISRFVRDHFVAPPAHPEPDTKLGGETTPLPVREYIDTMWDVLTREADTFEKHSSLLPLPHRYIVPGGRFREVYYWDSYFTMLGLHESGKHDLIEEMVKNFAHLISRYGCIPNGNRTYYLTRSQPPVFALMVELLAEINGEHIFETYSAHIQQEYDFWMRGMTNTAFSKETIHTAEHVVRMPDGEILNRYWDESISPREESFREDVEIGRNMDESAHFYRNMRAGAESGWDYSSRWFADGGGRSTIRVTDTVPVDLNIFLYKTEEILSRTYQRAGKFILSTKFDERATARREAMQKYFWDEESDWFYDYIHSEQRRSSRPTIAGMCTLFGGIATTEQATGIISKLESTFMHPGGVATTLENSGEQWDAPNGWAPLQYITIMGLERYGAHELAEEIAIRWCALNISVYEETGRLFEKYNIEDSTALATGGEYELQNGFGWTNGVLLTLMNKYHINKEIPKEFQAPLATFATEEETVGSLRK